MGQTNNTNECYIIHTYIRTYIFKYSTNMCIHYIRQEYLASILQHTHTHTLIKFMFNIVFKCI